MAESKQKRTELLTGIRKPAQRESEAFKADALKQLKKLKAGCIKTYLDLYKKARLSLTQDKDKKDLLNDLADPVIEGNFELLKAAQKKLLKDFMAAKELPGEICTEFLTAIQQALSGLAKLPVRLDDLKKALFPDGSPAKPAEFKERFNAYLDQILKGRDAAKVRLVIE